MLWIIAQNKESLVNVKEVTVKGKHIEGVMGSTSASDWSKKLGKYDSKERALEILNEIYLKVAESKGDAVTFVMPEQ